MARAAKPWFHAPSGWWVTDVGGKRQNLAYGEDQEGRAREVFAELVEDRDAGLITVRSVWEFYQKLQLPTLGLKNQRETVRIWNDFLREYGHLRCASLRALEFNLWFAKHPRWKSPDTGNVVIGKVKKVFAWAVKQEVIPLNPLRAVQTARGNRRRPMTSEEFELLHSHALPHVARVLQFMRLTGARPGEAIGMKWSDVDWQLGVVVLLKHKTVRKTGQPRVLVLSWQAQEFLRGLPSFGTSPIPFPGYRGRPFIPNSLSNAILKLRERLGISPEAKVYCIRHTFATEAIKAGVDIKSLSEMMGQTTTTHTEHYLHLTNDYSHLHAQAEKISQAPKQP